MYLFWCPGSKISQCGDVFENHALNQINIEVMNVSIHQKMREVLEIKKYTNRHDLSFYAKSHQKLHGDYIFLKQIYSARTKQKSQRQKP